MSDHLPLSPEQIQRLEQRGCSAEDWADVRVADGFDVERVRNLVEAIGCPVQAPDLGLDRWVALMQVDKKTEGGDIKFVVMSRIGAAHVRGVPREALERVLQRTVDNKVAR